MRKKNGEMRGKKSEERTGEIKAATERPNTDIKIQDPTLELS